MLLGRSLSYSPARVVKALSLDAEQQDATEFGQLLLGLLENKGGPRLKDTVQNLFVGRTSSSLLCRRGCRTAPRTEEFRELRLTVQKNVDLRTSLQVSAHRSQTKDEHRG